MYDSAAHPAVVVDTGGLRLDGSITATVHTVDLPDDGINGADSVLMINGRFVYYFFKDEHNSSISEFIYYHAHPVLADGALAVHSSICDETGMDGYPHTPPAPPMHPHPPSVPPGNVSTIFITTPELHNDQPPAPPNPPPPPSNPPPNPPPSPPPLAAAAFATALSAAAVASSTVAASIAAAAVAAAAGAAAVAAAAPPPTPMPPPSPPPPSPPNVTQPFSKNVTHSGWGFVTIF